MLLSSLLMFFVFYPTFSLRTITCGNTFMTRIDYENNRLARQISPRRQEELGRVFTGDNKIVCTRQILSGDSNIASLGVLSSFFLFLVFLPRPLKGNELIGLEKLWQRQGGGGAWWRVVKRVPQAQACSVTRGSSLSRYNNKVSFR